MGPVIWQGSVEASRVIAILLWLDYFAGQPTSSASPLSHGRFNGPRDGSRVGGLTSPSTLILRLYTHPVLLPILPMPGPSGDGSSCQSGSFRSLIPPLQPQMLCPAGVPARLDQRPPRGLLLPEVLPTKPLDRLLSLPSGSQPCLPFPLSFQCYQVPASATPLGMEVRR